MNAKFFAQKNNHEKETFNPKSKHIVQRNMRHPEQVLMKSCSDHKTKTAKNMRE